jgi:hypothetical protein
MRPPLAKSSVEREQPPSVVYVGRLPAGSWAVWLERSDGSWGRVGTLEFATESAARRWAGSWSVSLVVVASMAPRRVGGVWVV